MRQRKPSPYSSLSHGFERVMTERGSRPTPPAGTRNLRLEISYDGTAFQGYQYQPHAKTVQETLTRAWNTLAREEVMLFGCSRLDAGVSANHFVLNLYTRTTLDDERLVRGLNGILKSSFHEPIHVYRVNEMPPLFHARFDTVGKHYRYMIWYGHGTHALFTPQSWPVLSRTPPRDLAGVVAQYVGTHDFGAFRAQDCTAKTTCRTIHRIDTWQHPRFPELAILDFWGDGFLKNQIRNMVGTAVDIAIGKRPSDTIIQAFEHRERARTGQCAPAHALSLERVYYDPQEFEADVEQGAQGMHIPPRKGSP